MRATRMSARVSHETCPTCCLPVQHLLAVCFYHCAVPPEPKRQRGRPKSEATIAREAEAKTAAKTAAKADAGI
jgi:hypothetical protein